MPKLKGSEDKEASIIEVIQQMVQQGETEEKIVETLKDLGVEPAKAQRLLLLGQADTFALLRGEISKIVSDEIDSKMPELVQAIEEQAEDAGEKAKQKIVIDVKNDISKYEKAITGQSKTFQEQMEENVRRGTELSDRVREKLNELGAQVAQVAQDLDEMKVRGVGARNKLVAMILVFAGLAFCGYALFMFTFTFGAAVTIDAMIFTIMIALVGITMLFVSTLI